MSIASRHARLFVPSSATAALVAAAIAAATASPQAHAGNVAATPGSPALDNQLLAVAVPDECFNGIGVDYPPMNADGTCPEGIPKINESRIWGLTQESGKLWFGTLANSQCVVTGQVKGDDPSPILNNLYTCEFGESEGARTHPDAPAALGDWRPPAIYSYEMATGTLVKQDIQDRRINQTLGFRGAGSIDNIAFLGGQSTFRTTSAINIFAFKADTGDYLGSCSRTDYNYIRGWGLVDGVLYVGVGSRTHGAVLRWDGSMASFPGDFCSAFSEVASLPAAVANLTLYTGGDGRDRLAATTVALRNPVVAGAPGIGTWVSSPIPPGGFTPDNPGTWRQVWSPAQYDPDKVTGRFGYSGGAIAQYEGWLYWGTIHLGGNAAMGVHQKCTASYCFGAPANDAEMQALKDGVYRSTSLWRGRNLEDPGTREIQLLYGEAELPACCVEAKTFAMTSTGWTPLYGRSGFGNPNNEYTWRMAVFGGHLYIGTYDTSALQGAWMEAGADLWRFDTPDSPAVNQDHTGLGNRLNSGIRALEPLDDGSGLIVGTSNGFNLSPNGGWELILLKENPPQ